MPIYKILEKTIDEITYEIVHFPGDSKFVVYLWDPAKMKGQIAHVVPELGVFDTKEGAVEFLKKYVQDKTGM